MNFFSIIVLMSSVSICSHAAAASSAVSSQDSVSGIEYSHLKDALDKLLEVGAYDEASDLCFVCYDHLPKKFLGTVRLTLGKLALVQTERGMPVNHDWARWWFNQVIRSTVATRAEKDAARELLSSLEAADDKHSLQRTVAAKRAERCFEQLEPESKIMRTEQNILPFEREEFYSSVPDLGFEQPEIYISDDEDIFE